MVCSMLGLTQSGMEKMAVTEMAVEMGWRCFNTYVAAQHTASTRDGA
eukprot:COSAG01_NODE_41717_length_448_cov_0.790831_2_plen_46_part_01